MNKQELIEGYEIEIQACNDEIESIRYHMKSFGYEYPDREFRQEMSNDITRLERKIGLFKRFIREIKELESDVKSYTLEELEGWHDKYEKIGKCDGYCYECGINLFFTWLREVEK